MIRASVGEVVEAGICPRRFALGRAGETRAHPHGTPVGALVHGCASAFVARAAFDEPLRDALAPPTPPPDAVHRRVAALMDALLVERAAPAIDRFRADDLQRAGHAVRELSRLLSTAIRRARVAGAAPEAAAARALPAAERAFTLDVSTPAGPAAVSGRFDLLVRNDVDARLEVWELKTWVDPSRAADEQAALYAWALVDVEPGPRPAVLQIAGDGRVVLRAVPPLDEAKRAALGARVGAMAAWAEAPDRAPPTDERAHCAACPLRDPCWRRYGRTLAAEPPAVDVLIGAGPEGEAVRWSPGDAARPLPNFGFLVTGDTGSGKTQTVRALIAEVRAVGLPVLVFDFKNDYSDAAFASAAGLQVYDVRDHGLPWNPLALTPEAGVVRPPEQAHRVAAILGRVLGLGVQQEGALRRAMRVAYAARGLDGASFPAARRVSGPGLADVLAAVEPSGTGKTLRTRLEPLCDLGLLGADRADDDLAALLSGGAVLDLHRVVDERFKAVLAELAILALHSHLLAGEQPRRLTRLVVIDEAKRVAGSELLENLLREGRAFGAGFAIATQYPGDLPDAVAGALGTKLFLKNDMEAHRAAVARHLCGAASGGEAAALKQDVRALVPLEGFLVNAQHRPFTRVAVLPHHRRT